MNTGELLTSVNEIGLLELQGRLSLYINSIYERTEGANVSDERKQMNYELIRLLSDSKKKITELAESVSSKELRNFKYISHIQKLEKELETLKSNI